MLESVEKQKNIDYPFWSIDSDEIYSDNSNIAQENGNSLFQSKCRAVLNLNNKNLNFSVMSPLKIYEFSIEISEINSK